MEKSTGPFSGCSSSPDDPGGRSAAMPEQLPRQVGPFLIRGRLGAGGMGEVYRAFDPELEREVAVKVMKPEIAVLFGAPERFRREARVLARLQHERIVPVLQAGEERGTFYLVMPLLRGESLERRLERDPILPLEEVVRIGREVAEALAAAHQFGVVHRDIKPSNLWL